MVKNRSRRFSKHKGVRRLGMTLETLEKRNLLAPVINEIYVPQSQNTTTDQFFELRGEPNEVLPPGTFLAGVSSSVTGAGDITTLFDLSNNSFGPNGLMVLAQDNSPYTFNGGANILESQGPGFSGLPNFSSDGTGAPVTYIFFQTTSPPDLTNDIDSNNDGLIDPAGIAASWTIYDSVTIQGLATDPVFGYGETIFAALPLVRSRQPGSVEIGMSEGVDYVARQGNTSGNGADDWVASDVPERLLTTDPLRLGFLGATETVPAVYSGRLLNHVGAPNFFGGVSGRVFDGDSNTGLEDITVLADTNGNGSRDILTTTVATGAFSLNQEITNAIAGITLTRTGTGSDLPDESIEVVFDPDLNINTFGSTDGNNDSYTSNSQQLRADFYNGASLVSLDFVGVSTGSRAVGQLEAYDSAGFLLQTATTGQLNFGGQERLTVTSPGSQIAFVLASAMSTASSATLTPFNVRMDNLTVESPEVVATTDVDGNYHIPNLITGSYDITMITNSNVVLRSPIGGSESITITPNNPQFEVDFEVGDNRPPTLDGSAFSIREDAVLDDLVGLVEGVDPDRGQTLEYRVIGGTGSRVFGVNPETGEISVANQSELDFESAESYTLEVEAFDNFTPPLSTSATFDITVLDVNEAPVVPRRVFSDFAEDSPAGTVVGNVLATDFDAGVNGDFTFSLDQTGVGSGFTIDPGTGEIRLINPSAIDFEEANSIVLNVSATDNGTPPQTGTGEVVIRLSDVNEAPTLTPFNLVVPETITSTEVIGNVPLFDPDLEQSHIYEIVGGNADGVIEVDSNTGAIKLVDGQTLNHEEVAFYSIDLRVTDSGTPPLSVEGSVDIVVGDVDELPVVEVDLGPLSENSPAGTFVGTVSAFDPEGDSLTVSLVRGADIFDFDFNPLTNSGDITVRGGTIDFETTDSLDLLLLFADRSSPPNTSVASISVPIADVAEAPSILSTEFSVSENKVDNEPIGAIDVFDPDLDSSTYSIIGGTGANLFTVDQDNGELRLVPGTQLDFEANSVYQLEVVVEDATGLTDQAFVQINVTNANEPPSIIDPIPNEQIEASRQVTVTFPDRLFRDPESDDLVIEVSSTIGPLPSWLSYDPTTRTLTGTPSNADIGANSIVVRVTDTGTPPLAATQAFTINVLRNAFPWQNPNNQQDVNGDTLIQPIDALQIVNFLNSNGAFNVPENLEPPQFYDVNGDNRVTPVDAVIVLNRVNDFLGFGEAPIAVQREEATSPVVDSAIEQLTSEQAFDSQTVDDAVSGFAAQIDSFTEDEEQDEEAVDAMLTDYLL